MIFPQKNAIFGVTSSLPEHHVVLVLTRFLHAGPLVWDKKDRSRALLGQALASLAKNSFEGAVTLIAEMTKRFCVTSAAAGCGMILYGLSCHMSELQSLGEHR